MVTRMIAVGESLTDIHEILELLSQDGATIRVWHSSARKRDQAYMTLVCRPKILVRMVDDLQKRGLISTEARDYPFDYVITEQGRAELAKGE